MSLADQAQIMQKELNKISDQQREERFFGHSESKLVRIKLQGDMEVSEVKLNRKLLELDNALIRQLQADLKEAINDALQSAKDRSKERLTETAESLGQLDGKDEDSKR
jgi:DNA-binding protein YbaB